MIEFKTTFEKIKENIINSKENEDVIYFWNGRYEKIDKEIIKRFKENNKLDENKISELSL